MTIGELFSQAADAASAVNQIPTNLSGYQMHKVVNQLRREAGLTKDIPPQMMYNYLTKGYVSPETFPSWVIEYIQRAVKRAS
jgi:hypothetical protein